MSTNTRTKGTFFYETISYDSSAKMPFDARMLVPSYDALLNIDNWKVTKEGQTSTLHYNGMIVAVADKEDEEHSGVYMLLDCVNDKPDPTNAENWRKLCSLAEANTLVENQTGVSSWNDLTDKPFYDQHTPLGNTLTWDGEETDISVEIDGEVLHYISSATPNAAELIGAIFSDSNGLSLEIEAGALQTLMPNVLGVKFNGSPAIYVVYQDNVSAGQVTFPKAGVYVFRIQGVTYPVFLEKPTGEWTSSIIKKIDSKFLPEQVIALSLEESQGINLAAYPVGTLFVLYDPSTSL